MTTPARLSLLFGPRRDCQSEAGLHGQLARVAARQTDAIAIIDGERKVTYGELIERVRALAEGLRGLGVGKGSAVGLYFERSIENVVAIFAVLEAGGAYVPLDPAQPAERLQGMVRDCGIALVLAGSGLPAVALPPEVRLLDPATLSGAAALSPEPLPDASDERASILFTSGSTGRPKGAQLTHRSLCAVVINSDAFAFRPDDVIAHVSNLAFDASALEIFGALLNGGRLVIFPPGAALDPGPFLESLGRAGVTFLVLTAALFQRLAEAVPARFGFLRLLVCGGDVLSPAACRAVLESGSPPGTLLNGYGPAESGVCCTAFRVRRVEPGAGAIPIGRVLANNQVYLLDEARQPVAAGQQGELYVGGPKVALGYAGQPELTRASFFPDPFAETPAARMYKTGDLARLREDGELEFLGRIDEQVKIRGFRVEPAEIEAALQAHPRVGQSRVRTWPPTGADRKLIGYVSPRNGARPQLEELRAFLHTRLPEYSVPSALMVVEAWPLTPNGKIDTALLPLPAAEPEKPSAAPRTEVEAVLVELWTSVLGVPPVSLEQDFFLAGGHSLLAIQLMSRVRERLGVQIPVRRLFETPNLQGLAAWIEEHRPAPEMPAGEHLVPMQKGEPGRRPLFIVPGGTGRGAELLALVRLLRGIGAEQPAFGFKVSEREGAPPRTPAEMAAAYLRELRQVQPAGPYALLGECVGGVVAYEMARQLEADGEEVALLVVLDTTWPDASVRRWFRWQKSVWDRFEFWQRQWHARVRQPLRDHVARLRELRWAERMSYLWERKARFTLFATDAPSAPLTPEQDAYLRSIMASPPRPYHGNVVLLVAEAHYREYGSLGWTAHPGALEEHVLRGDHTSCIREHAESTGAKLRELLSAVAPLSR